MFAKDTNLIYLHHDTKTLFSTVNEELCKNSVKDNIPLKLPELHISNKRKKAY